jgi:hypothetical protein
VARVGVEAGIVTDDTRIGSLIGGTLLERLARWYARIVFPCAARAGVAVGAEAGNVTHFGRPCVYMTVVLLEISKQ